jgi:hypothetical protein
MKPIAVIVFCVLAALATVTRAQDTVPGTGADPALAAPGTVPGPAPSRRAVPRADPQPLEPYRWGAFLVYPELVFTGLSDDNIYSSSGDGVNDHALIVSPAVWVVSNWERHLVRMHVSADFARYLDQRTEDTDDYRASIESRHDVSADANVYGGMRVAREHEDRESPEVRNGIEPTRYLASRAYAGLFQQFGRASLRLGLNSVDLDFDDVPFVRGDGSIGIINNDDRDRVQWGVGARVGYELAPRLVLFTQLSVDNRRYESATDDLGYARSSDGTRALVGVRTYVPERLKLEFFAGHMRQDYDDARLADVSNATAGGNLVLRMTEDTTASLFADRTVEETTVFAAGTPVQPASAYLNSYLQANVEHRFTPVFSVYAFGSLSRVDYVGIDRVDDYKSGGAGFVYRLSRRVYVDATYQHRKLDSALPAENFKRNQVFARLAVPLSR